MDFNEDEVLISLRNMENSDDDYEEEDDDVGPIENCHPNIIRHSSYHQATSKVLLPWFDLRVFYVRVSKCVIKGDSTPEYLTLNHVPLTRNTLLEANGVRSSIYSDGVSTLLKRDRLDKKSEEVTFVSTDSVRMTASVKFEVLYKDVMLLSGTLLCNSNGFESKNHQMSPVWSMDCESDVVGDGFLKGHNKVMENVGSPCIEVYVAGSFSGTPVILTKTLQLSHRRKRKLLGNLESIPEYEVTTQCQMDNDSPSLTNQSRHFPDYQKEYDEIICSSSYGGGMEYLELGEDGELSWFNAGVRVGVGIGLSICLGVGIGVGLVVRTYQGTARNFTRHLL